MISIYDYIINDLRGVEWKCSTELNAKVSNSALSIILRFKHNINSKYYELIPYIRTNGYHWNGRIALGISDLKFMDVRFKQFEFCDNKLK